MKVTKVNAILILIYCICNVVYIFKLDTQVNDMQIQLDKSEEQIDAASQLLLAHMKIHDIKDMEDRIKQGSPTISPIFPKIQYE